MNPKGWDPGKPTGWPAQLPPRRVPQKRVLPQKRVDPRSLVAITQQKLTAPKANGTKGPAPIPRCRCCKSPTPRTELLAYDSLCQICWTGQCERCSAQLAEDATMGEDPDELAADDEIMDQVDEIARKAGIPESD